MCDEPAMKVLLSRGAKDARDYIIGGRVSCTVSSKSRSVNSRSKGGGFPNPTVDSIMQCCFGERSKTINDD